MLGPEKARPVPGPRGRRTACVHFVKPCQILGRQSCPDNKMDGDAGLEPARDGFKDRCLTNLANPQNGCGGGTRTLIVRLMRPGWCLSSPPRKKQKPRWFASGS